MRRRSAGPNTAQTLGLDSRPSLNHDVIVQQTPDAHVLLHTGTGQYYSLDELGGRIWQLCDGSRRIADIVAVLCDEYDAPRSEIETDAMALVGELAEERLLSTP